MDTQPKEASLLSGYRVLDLTEGWHLFCGRILGDMGAEVIKIERPGGSPSRSMGPFYRDEPDSEKSLFWFAYNTNKKSITLDIEKSDGQMLFRRLVERTDFLVESFPIGYMESLGLDYSVLSQINPGLIMTSISPYGQTGPYAHFAASDITTWAMGGNLYNTGFPDEEPVWFGCPQSSLVASAHAAAASMLALWYRNATGEGQYVDVSEQQGVVWLTYNATMMWDLTHTINRRQGNSITTLTVPLNICFPCKDGHVCLLLMGGGNPIFVAGSQNVVKWMDEEGMAPQWLKDVDWVNDYDATKLNPELLDKVNAAVEHFTLTKTKAELYNEGFKRKILVAPIDNTKDIFESEQLKARAFWCEIEHPELGESLTYCGPLMKVSEAPLRIRKRAPLIGEHNAEIYRDELGLSDDDLVLFKQIGVL